MALFLIDGLGLRGLVVLAAGLPLLSRWFVFVRLPVSVRLFASARLSVSEDRRG